MQKSCGGCRWWVKWKHAAGRLPSDLPYDNWEQNFEYVAETLARFYVYVDEKLNEDDLK